MEEKIYFNNKFCAYLSFVKVINTKYANHAYEFIQNETLDRFDGIISVGGDGMFSEVVFTHTNLVSLSLHFCIIRFLMDSWFELQTMPTLISITKNLSSSLHSFE